MTVSRRQSSALLMGAWAGGMGGHLGAAPAPSVRMAVGLEADDRRFDFPVELLGLALQASGYEHELVKLPGQTHGRRELGLIKGDLDVAILPTSTSLREGLQPIRFPLRRGLLGLRLLLAPYRLHARLSALTDVAPLKRDFTMGYGADWGDLAQMRNLGFRLVVANSYSNLFRMLTLRRFDYLSRGVNEIWAEIDHPTLVSDTNGVVPEVALFYPLDDYFVVSPHQPQLYSALTAGLALVWKDGRYRNLFRAYFARSLERADLPQRRVLHVVGYGAGQGTVMADFDALQVDGGSLRLHLPGK